MEERLILCNCKRLHEKVKLTDEELDRRLSTVTEFELHDEDLPEIVEIELTGAIYSEGSKDLIMIRLDAEQFFIEYINEHSELLQYLVRRMIFHNLLSDSYTLIGFDMINWKKELEIEK
jgi:hypothetical protein